MLLFIQYIHIHCFFQIGKIFLNILNDVLDEKYQEVESERIEAHKKAQQMTASLDKDIADLQKRLQEISKYDSNKENQEYIRYYKKYLQEMKEEKDDVAKLKKELIETKEFASKHLIKNARENNDMMIYNCVALLFALMSIFLNVAILIKQ